MKFESLDEFLKRGGSIKKIETPEHKPDTRSGYTWKDKVDVVVGKNRYGADKRFDQFAEAFLKRGNRHWRYSK